MIAIHRIAEYIHSRDAHPHSTRSAIVDPKASFSLAKLIEAGLKGDKSVFASYSKQLEKALRESGDIETADRIAAAAKSPTAKRASVSRANRPMPVDSESRTP